MRWPWGKQKRGLAEAQEEKRRAEQRERDVQPLVHDLRRHDRKNHLAARVRVAFGGRPK